MRLFIIFFIATFLAACSTTGSLSGENSIDEKGGISAKGAIDQRLETGPLFAGDGGKNIRLAVIAPSIQGDVPGYLPIYIQGLLNNNIGKYSAISLIDRQNLDKIIAEQSITASGAFSDNDLVRIGNLTNTQYFLFGTIQRMSGNRYSLQLVITESNTGVRKASSMKEGTLSQLEGSGTLINEATAELLALMGVQLTGAGRQTLLAGNNSVVRAEQGVAKGIRAQAGGDAVEALFNFTQAATFDPSQIEALSRLTTLSTAISGGSISERIVNDIQARNRWIEVFKETTQFYNDHPPFEIIFDPNLFQIGETNYEKNMVTLGMRMALKPSQASFTALNTLIDGLEKTGRRSVWQFSGWPLIDTNPSSTTKGTTVFNGNNNFSYKVDVALINEKGKSLSRSSVILTTSLGKFSSGDKKINIPKDALEIINFSNINAIELTPTLTIAIVAVNGITTNKISETGFMRIDAEDLAGFHQQQLTAEAAAKKREDDVRKREEKKKREDKEKEMRENPLYGSYWGAVFNGGYTMEAGTGILDLGFIIGYKGISGEFGVSMYSGIQEDKVGEYVGSTKDVKFNGINFGLSYSLLFPKWHISLGGGFTYLYTDKVNEEDKSSTSSDSKDKLKEVVPNAQAWLNWRIINIFFVRAGYRCDFYPADYRNFFIDSTKESEGLFMGHSIMIGLLFALPNSLFY